MKKRILFLCLTLMAVCHIQAWAAEVNNTCATALPVNPASNISASCDPSGATLYYRFTPSQSGMYRISGAGAGTFTPSVYTGSCDKLTVVTNSSSDNNYDFTAEADTSYTIEWRCMPAPVENPPATINFSWGLVRQDDAPTTDNTPCATAQPVNPASNISASYEDCGGSLYYRFTPSQSGLYRVSGNGITFASSVYTGSCDNLTTATNYSLDSYNYDFIAEADTSYTIKWVHTFFETWEGEICAPPISQSWGLERLGDATSLSFSLSNLPASLADSAAGYTIGIQSNWRYCYSGTGTTDTAKIDIGCLLGLNLGAGERVSYSLSLHNAGGDRLFSADGEFTYNGDDQHVEISLAKYHTVNFEISLLDGITAVDIGIFDYSGNYIAYLDPNASLTTYLPKGRYYVRILASGWNYIEVDFEVSEANTLTTVSYTEVKPVFTFSGLPQSVFRNASGSIYSDERMNSNIAGFDFWSDYTAHSALAKGASYYYLIEEGRIAPRMGEFTAADTVDISFAHYHRLILETNVASTDWVGNYADILQNGERISSSPLVSSSNPLQYIDTMYIPNGSYTLRVAVADTAHGYIPLTVNKDFTITGNTELSINAIPSDLNLVSFSLSNLPITPVDTNITIYDEHGSRLLDLYGGNLSCYLPNGSYRYEVDLGSSSIVNNSANFTVSKSETVNISYSEYYNIFFEIILPDIARSIFVYDAKGDNALCILSYENGDSVAYLPGGSYKLDIATYNIGSRETYFTVSDANKTVKYEEISARFTIAGLPESLMQRVQIPVYDRNGKHINTAVLINNLTVNGLEKGALYSYNVFPFGPGLLGVYTGTFTADTSVTLTDAYHQVVANITAPAGRYLVNSASVNTQEGGGIPTPPLNLNLSTYPPYTDTLYAASGSYVFNATAYDTVTLNEIYAHKEFVVAGSDMVATLDFATDGSYSVIIDVPDAPRGVNEIIIYDKYGKNIARMPGSHLWARLPNGSYTYRVDAPDALDIEGAFTVSGSNRTVNVSFADYQPVTFKYTLPEEPNDGYIGIFMQNGFDYIDISGISDSVTYYLPNGTYSWLVKDEGKWSMPQGEFTVNGAPLTLSFVSQTLHKVAFVPEGNNAKTTAYYISVMDGNGIEIAYVDRIRQGAYADTLLLPAGSYTYSASQGLPESIPSTGSFTVSSGTQSANISFENTYEVKCFATAAAGSTLPLSGINLSVLQNGSILSNYQLFSGAVMDIYLPAGTYTFRIVNSGYKIIEKTVTIAADASNEVELIMEKINLYSLNFNTIAGATVAAAGKTLTADAEGQVLLTDIPAGYITYTISKEGYQSASGTIYVGPGSRESVNITLMQLYNATFNVYNGATGTTFLSGASVTLQGYGTLTVSDNSLTFSNVASGSYTYVVSKEGYETQSGTITIVNGNVSKSVNMVEEQPYTFKVVVYDQAAAPDTYLSGATVSVTGQNPQTVANDTLYFTGLKAGIYTISISKSGYFTQSPTISFFPGMVVDRTIVEVVSMKLKPANLKRYTLAFTTYDNNTGDLISGASVAIAGGETKTATATEPLYFAVDSGDNIGYTVSKEGYMRELDTYVANELNTVNDTAYIYTSLHPAQRYTIEFKVYDGSSTTYLTGASVQLQGQAAQTVDNAALSFTNLLPGSYSYSVSKSGYATQSGTLNVTGTLDLTDYTLTKIINLAEVTEPSAVAKNTIAVVVYPNPASHTLYIKGEGDDAYGAWDIKLYNINGGLVKQERINDLNGASVSVEQLSSGLYILSLSNGRKTATHKVRVR